MLVHHGLPTMINHGIASSAYHLRGRDVFLLYISRNKCDLRSFHLKKLQAFSLQTYPRQSLFGFNERSYIFHRNEHRLDHMLSIYTTYSDWSKLKR